ncbi:Solute carrier family 22 member 7, partial [Ophiophagus hannah]
MNFEELLREVGGFGRFQILTLLLLCFPRLLLPLHFLLHNFLAAIPGHHCAIPHQQQFANLTKEEVLIINIPRDFNGAFSSCEMFSEPQFHLLLNSSLELTNVSVQSCQYGWIYDQSQFISTIATQWNLVCEHKSLNQATATFFFFGVMFGAVIFGDLSDRFGRKRMLLVSYLGTLIFGVLSSASVSYSMFAVTWTLTGMSICGLSIIVIPLGMEWVDIEHRTVSGVITSLYWSFGNMLLALIAYLVRDWHWLLLTISLPCIVGIISLWWSLLKTAAVIRQKSDGNYSYISLFRTPMLRRISFCMAAVWFGAAFSYYIMSMNITGFGLGMYMTQFVFGFIEVPAKLLVFVMVNRVGRRKSQAWVLILSGLSVGINIIVPTSQGILRSVIAIIGKGFAEAAFTIVFLYSSELYPTILRQSGQGYCSFMARLGASVAPLAFLLNSIWKPLPQVAAFAMAVLC